MTHALLDPEYHRRIAESVRTAKPGLRVVIADGPDEAGFDELETWDSIRHAGEDVLVVEIDHQAGQMVVLDGEDRCEVISDCAGQTFTRTGF